MTRLPQTASECPWRHRTAQPCPVLELWLAVLGDCDLAVVLYLELDAAILAPGAVALEEPLAVSEGVVRLGRRFVDGLGKVGECSGFELWISVFDA